MLSFRHVLAVAVAIVIVAAPSAIAHSTLELSDPGPGETVEGTVTHIELMFSEDFRNISIVLEDPEGNIVDGSIETVNARTARLLVPALQRGGEYLVRYDVLSQDSDPVASSYAVTFSAPRGRLLATPHCAWPPSASSSPGARPSRSGRSGATPVASSAQSSIHNYTVPDFANQSGSPGI